MTGTTHVAMALAGGLALAGAGYAPSGWEWAALAIGGLGPDIDSGGGTIARPGSLMSQVLPRWLVKLLDAIGITISKWIRAILGHREMTHWPVIGAAMFIAGLYLGWGWLVWLGVGWMIHILGDFCTVSGVPILGPISTKEIKWSPLRTGSTGESVVALLLWGFIVYAGWGYIPAEFRGWILSFAGGFTWNG